MSKYFGPEDPVAAARYGKLIGNNSKLIGILQKAVEIEESDAQKEEIGWEWHEVNAYPATLVKLVVDGLIKIPPRAKDALST